MPLDISDALDSYLAAKVNLNKWQRDFEENFYRPIIKALPGTIIRVAKQHPAINQQKLRENLSQQGLDILDGDE